MIKGPRTGAFLPDQNIYYSAPEHEKKFHPLLTMKNRPIPARNNKLCHLHRLHQRHAQRFTSL